MVYWTLVFSWNYFCTSQFLATFFFPRPIPLYQNLTKNGNISLFLPHWTFSRQSTFLLYSTFYNYKWQYFHFVYFSYYLSKTMPHSTNHYILILHFTLIYLGFLDNDTKMYSHHCSLCVMNRASNNEWSLVFYSSSLILLIKTLFCVQNIPL